MKRILIAEDEQSIRELVAFNLKRNGYDVTEAETGETALKLYDECGGNFDIALLDIMMPGVDGLEVCKQLRKKSSTLGIILLTAKTQEMDKVTGLLAGADDYVTKPFSPAELILNLFSDTDGSGLFSLISFFFFLFSLTVFLLTGLFSETTISFSSSLSYMFQKDNSSEVLLSGSREASSECSSSAFT